MSNNNDNSGGIMIFAFVAAIAYFVFLFVAALAGFITIIFTILSLFAWHRELRLGKLILTPQEARGFIGRGILGTFLTPLFVLFCEFLFEFQFNWDEFGGYVFFAGYVLGSLGVGMLMEKAAEEEQQRQAMHHPVQTFTPPPVQRGLPAPPKEPFRYASWDDDEGR